MKSFKTIEANIQYVLSCLDFKMFYQEYLKLDMFEKIELIRFKDTKYIHQPYFENIISLLKIDEIRREYAEAISNPQYKIEHKEYIDWYIDKESKAEKIKQKHQKQDFIFWSVIILILLSPIAYYILWPVLKIIWMIIALPFEAMTDMDISGVGAPTVRLTEPTLLGGVLGILGTLFMIFLFVNFIISLLKK